LPTEEDMIQRIDQEALTPLRRVSRGMMLGGISIFVFENFVFNVVYLGSILPALGKESYTIPFFLLFNSFWGMAACCFIRAHCTPAGTVPEEWYDFADKVGRYLPVDLPKQEWQVGRATLCEKCLAPRPERAHHCLICDTCVLRMDHHCPWINNCVGFTNQKFFLLLTFYGFLASAVPVACSAPELVACISYAAGTLDGTALEGNLRLSICDISLFIVFYGVAWGALVGLWSLSVAHLRFAVKNLTSIEDNYDNMPNPYDLGSSRLNLQQVMGTCGPDWFLPIRPWNPTTDGCSFSRKDEFCEELPDESLDNPPEGEGRERLWRARYGVMSSTLGDVSDVGPIESLRRWWMGLEETEKAAAMSRAKRRNLLLCNGCVRPGHSLGLHRRSYGGG